MTLRRPSHLQGALAEAELTGVELGAVTLDTDTISDDVGGWSRTDPDLIRYGERWFHTYHETFGPALPAGWFPPLPLPPPDAAEAVVGTELPAIVQALSSPGPELASLLSAVAAGRGGLAGVLGQALQSAGQGDALGAVATAVSRAGGAPAAVAQTLLQLAGGTGPGQELAGRLLDVAAGKLPPLDLLRGLAGAHLPQVVGAVARFLPPPVQQLAAVGVAALSRDPAGALLAALPPPLRPLLQAALPLAEGNLPHALASVTDRFVPPALRPLLRVAQQAGSVGRLLRLPPAPSLPVVGGAVAPGPLPPRGRRAQGGAGPWAARMSDARQCPQGAGVILSPCAPTVLFGNLPAARQTDLCTCSSGPPDQIARGEASVLISGLPAARLGDPTAHGGAIIAGLPTVWIGSSTAGAAHCLKVAARNGAATIAELNGGA